jgi:hypothetical protein
MIGFLRDMPGVGVCEVYLLENEGSQLRWRFRGSRAQAPDDQCESTISAIWLAWHGRYDLMTAITVLSFSLWFPISQQKARLGWNYGVIGFAVIGFAHRTSMSLSSSALWSY